MGAPERGVVVLVRFPFSDLSSSKLRPGKLFTANSAIVDRVVGSLESSAFNDLIDAVVAVLRGDET